MKQISTIVPTTNPPAAPLFPILAVNLFSALLFLAAPVDWGTQNQALLIVLVVVTQFGIILGYRTGWSRGLVQLTPREYRLSASSLLGFLIVAYSVTLPVHYAYIARTSITNPLELAAFFEYAWTDSSIGRRIVLDSEIQRSVPWRFYFLIAMVNRLFFPICFILWSRVGRTQRVIISALLVIEVVFWAAAGTTFGIVSIATNYMFARLIGGGGERRRPSSVRTIVAYSAIGFGSLFVFLYNLYSRSGRAFLEASNFSIEDLGVSVNSESLAFAVLPDVLLSPFMYLVSYLCQGYYHTCLAFDLDWVWTRFCGSVPAIMDFAVMAKVDQMDNTYMVRLGAYGVDPLMNWHSSYTWYANDVSYFGVPLLIAGMAHLFGFSLARSRTGDLASKLIFVILGNALFFLWANNTYLSTVFYPFMLLFPFWMFTRFLSSREQRIVTV